MAFSWTGSKHARKHSGKPSHGQVQKHFHFLLVITNLRTSYRTAMGVEMVLLTALVATLSATSLLGKVPLETEIFFQILKNVWVRLGSLPGSGRFMQLFRELTQPSLQ